VDKLHGQFLGSEPVLFSPIRQHHLGDDRFPIGHLGPSFRAVVMTNRNGPLLGEVSRAEQAGRVNCQAVEAEIGSYPVRILADQVSTGSQPVLQPSGIPWVERW